MATDPQGHVINESNMPRFHESSTRYAYQPEQPIDKLIKAASQPSRNDGSDGRPYVNIAHKPSMAFKSSNALHDYNRSRFITNTSAPAAPKLPGFYGELPQDLHAPGFRPAMTDRPMSQSDIAGGISAQTTTFPPLQAVTNTRHSVPALTHEVLTQDNNLMPKYSKSSPTMNDSNFRYMYLTDNDVSNLNSATAKYTGRLITHESMRKMPRLESSESRDMESLPPQKSYICAHKGCTWSFSRPSDLRRHAKSHRAPAFHCPYYANDSSCHRNGGSFSRSDVLKRHLRLMHYVRDRQMLYPGPDPGWCRSCQKMFESTKAFLDHCSECAAQMKPAVWKERAIEAESGN